jgi:hypothetical protein
MFCDRIQEGENKIMDTYLCFVAIAIWAVIYVCLHISPWIESLKQWYSERKYWRRVYRMAKQWKKENNK